MKMLFALLATLLAAGSFYAGEEPTPESGEVDCRVEDCWCKKYRDQTILPEAPGADDRAWPTAPPQGYGCEAGWPGPRSIPQPR